MSVVGSLPLRGSAVLRGGRILDAQTLTPTEGLAIVVRDGVIERLIPDRADHLPELPTIDLAGHFAMSGLINMHTHFSLTLPGVAGERIAALDPAGMALYMADGARRTLLNGVTTTRSVAEKDFADFALRDAIDSGHVPGPRMFTGGKALCCTGGHGHDASDTQECDGPVGFAHGVRSQIKHGADHIKIMLTGGIAGEHEQIGTAQMTREETASAISTAHAWGRKVTAHAGPADAIRMAVEEGLDCVEHGYQLTPEVTDLMAQHGTALTPTLIVTRAKPFFDELGVPAWMQARSLGAADRHDESFRYALKSGVDILLGSDMPPFWPFEGTSATVREIEHMHAAGMSAIEVLRASTTAPARWLGVEDSVGRIAPGFSADIIAMEADPTESPSALRDLSLVMKDGVVWRGAGAVA
ncbi:amidohydrolase family protein [Demequina sp. NBRC 110054]|uniref:metal-dependent hydrolase family protein n=1 Tax=Demequina sp. NBRC 110054 TaxID=1570343 RepID=UPI0009FF0A75|nr:amidohydrolase family protein [Demequina sp. NBRC 110054]